MWADKYKPVVCDLAPYPARGRRLHGYKFRRQMPIGRYIADFVCEERRLIVETDGAQYAEQCAYDAGRSRDLQQSGYTVLRFWNHEILQETEAVLARILLMPDSCL